MLDWKVVPIDRWPGEMTRHRKRATFRAAWEHSRTSGMSTLDLLEREVGQLKGKNVLMQMAVTDSDIRLDGKIRANARPAAHPGVILTFDSKHGPLQYAVDLFDDWQDNVRAIALSLEALRKVDRYGCTKTGEQYSGWKKLPGAGGTTVTMSVEEAAQVLVDIEGLDGDEEDVAAHAEVFRVTYRNAAKRTHPDAGGSVRDFQRLQEAKVVLEAHHGRTPSR